MDEWWSLEEREGGRDIYRILYAGRIWKSRRDERLSKQLSGEQQLSPAQQTLTLLTPGVPLAMSHNVHSQCTTSAAVSVEPTKLAWKRTRAGTRATKVPSQERRSPKYTLGSFLRGASIQSLTHSLTGPALAVSSTPGPFRTFFLLDGPHHRAK